MIPQFDLSYDIDEEINKSLLKVNKFIDEKIKYIYFVRAISENRIVMETGIGGMKMYNELINKYLK